MNSLAKWDGPVKTDSTLWQVGFELLFKLVRRAVAEGGVAAVEVKVGQIVGHFQSSFFEGGKRAAAGQRFGFNRTSAGFGLRITVEIAQPAEASYRSSRNSTR